MRQAAHPGTGAPGTVTYGLNLQGLIRAANARVKDLPAVPDEIAASLIRAFRHGVILGLGQVKCTQGRKQRPCRDLLECLRDRQADVLRFPGDLRIPPTSNQAERDLRPAKTQQKISGRLRSEQATRHPRLRLHRRQARHQRPHRAARRPRQQPLDATDPRAPVTQSGGHVKSP
jgi:hypothetical protein